MKGDSRAMAASVTPRYALGYTTAEHDRLIAQGRAEHARLVAETTIHQAAVAQSERTIAEAQAKAQRLRSETDTYVDERLAAIGELLTKTLRSVDNGRAQLRADAGQPRHRPQR